MGMIDTLVTMLEFIDYKRKMSALEFETLSTELMIVYLGDKKSPLMELLISKDFVGFQNLVLEMNAIGLDLKHKLKGDNK